jgi:hypothetical protein
VLLSLPGPMGFAIAKRLKPSTPSPQAKESPTGFDPERSERYRERLASDASFERRLLRREALIVVVIVILLVARALAS